MTIVAISDTHNRHEAVVLPPGDILIHAGDFTGHGTPEEVERFLRWFGALEYRTKILVAGNHDFLFEQSPGYAQRLIQEHAPGTIYLEDSSAVVEGATFHGSPRTPRFYDWAFNVDRGENIRRYWDRIPAETDVLITHGPPIGHRDLADGKHVGCEELRDRITKLPRLKLHIFGHIHPGY
ncbi:MAG: metallophosphatase domain-containing protein [Candidatus Kapaibacterium sp.]